MLRTPSIRVTAKAMILGRPEHALTTHRSTKISSEKVTPLQLFIPTRVGRVGDELNGSGDQVADGAGGAAGAAGDIG